MEKELMGKPLRSLPFLVVECDTGIVLKRGTTEILVEGETALETVLLILTATATSPKTTAEITELFPVQDRVPVQLLLDEMYAKRLLIPADDGALGADFIENNEDIFYWSASTQRSDVVQALSDLRIVIAGVNKITQLILNALHAMGVTNPIVIDDPALRSLEFYDEGGGILLQKFNVLAEVILPEDFKVSTESNALMIAATEFGATGLLLPWNDQCVHQGMHFMPVVLKDMIGYAGPLVIPGDTACLQCVMMRQNAHLQDARLIREIESHMDRGQSIAAIHPSMLKILSETVVFELCLYYGGLPEQRPGRLIKINLPAGQTENKRVLKIPRCPVCSTIVSRSSVQVRKLTPLPK